VTLLTLTRFVQSLRRADLQGLRNTSIAPQWQFRLL